MSLDYKHANEIIKSKTGHSVWLGDCAAAEDLSWLREHNIKTVITAAVGLKLDYDSSIWHYRYPLEDSKSQNIAKFFDEVGDRIHKNLKKGSILVHCAAGVSRSATLVIAYLIKFHKMTFLEALRFTKSARPEICPNLGFELQLKKYADPKQVLTPQGHTTRDNFYKPDSVNFKTFVNFPISGSLKNESFPQINKLAYRSVEKGEKEAGREGGKEGGKEERRRWVSPYQSPKSRVGSHMKKTRQKDSEYIKKMAQFRFGMTNTFNWGLV